MNCLIPNDSITRCHKFDITIIHTKKYKSCLNNITLTDDIDKLNEMELQGSL